MRSFATLSSIALALGVTTTSLLGSAVPASTPAWSPLTEPAVAHAQSATFRETFTGRPASPTAYRPAGWDVLSHSRNRETWQQPESMMAGHGADCSAHPASHLVNTFPDTVFQCNDHLMTAINAGGYGAIYLAPNHLVDFSNGEATVRFDLSTLRTSHRDWVDVWITPYEENVPAPLEEWLPDLTGLPKRAIHVRMDVFNGTTMFRGSVIRNFVSSELPSNWWTGYETFLTPSAVRRDTFELKLSKTGMKFGMPGYDNFQWVNQQFPALDWSRGVVQFSHHSYNPTKDCDMPSCAPNTWHWDNVEISPAVPFTIISGDRGLLTGSNPVVTFSGPAPADSHLRFIGIGSNLQASYDGGPWQNLTPRQTAKNPDDAFKPYWAPIPAGTRQVRFRGTDWWGGPWAINGVAVWSLNAAGSSPAPIATSPAAATVTATPTGAAATVTTLPATATPTQPPATSTPVSTATPTATALPPMATATQPAAIATATPAAPAGGSAPNRSLKLTGSAHAVAPYAPELNLNGDWTVELWFKDEVGSAGFGHEPQTLLISGETDWDAEIGLHARVEWGNLVVGDRRGWNSQTASYPLTAKGVQANSWHHLAVTKSASTRRLQIVLDGRLVHEQTLAGQNPSPNGRGLTIGRNGSQHNWRGKLDDIRVWNVVRPVSEISASYRSELTGSPSGLVANWKLNEASGNSIPDSAGSPQNATIKNGGTWTTDVHP